MMFFKRLSKQRDSYLDDYDSQEKLESTHSFSGPAEAKQMPARTQTSHGDVEAPQQTHIPTNTKAPVQARAEPMPDLLSQAFNAAVKPYIERIEQMEKEMLDLSQWVASLEAQRDDLFSWIDKRGLRPDVPPNIAKVMDRAPDAAQTLNAQLDRKITIINFDLHRLQDDLNETISSTLFVSAMVKTLPDIERLASLPAGSRMAYDLVLKLAGNLTSHEDFDTASHQEAEARQDFYLKLDNIMAEIVRRRFQDGEDIQIPRELKRMDKTGAYLKSQGVVQYFPKTQELMRRELDFRSTGMPPNYHQ